MVSLQSKRVSNSLVVLVIITLVVFSVSGYYLLSKTRGIESPSTTESHSASSTGIGAQETFGGLYQWQFPCVGAHGSPCPVGFRVQGNSYSNYTTLLSGSGSFNFTVDPISSKGAGLGQGTATATTTGYCNGQTTIAYTFPISAFLTSGNNVTMIFGTPTPLNSTIQLSCTDAGGQRYQGSGIYQIISVFPNIINMRAVPGTELNGTSGNTAYEVSLLWQNQS